MEPGDATVSPQAQVVLKGFTQRKNITTIT
jgi:hypothetical protein